MGLAMFRNFVSKDKTNTSFSIIVICRNEAKNLPDLFNCLNKIDYPLYEIILVDDASQDDTLKMIKEFSSHNRKAKYIHLQTKSEILKGKKAGLQAAAEITKYEFLLFLDADCLPPANWLHSMNKFTDKETGMVIGYSPEIGVSSFRYYTRMMSAAIYAVTAGMGIPFSCSGGNLAVNKKAFFAVDGYKSIGQYQAGDDKLLLKLINRTSYKVRYNPRVAVYTKPQVEHFSQQQKRRYGKFAMSTPFYQILSILVFCFYIFLPIQLIANFSYFIFGIYFSSTLFFLFAFLVTHREKFKPEYALFNLIYPYYLIFHTIRGSLGKWKWKS
jgi:cellulose synthase/poly-beta-1,6-N-acetylglucosamine synthase-like glycosyltransferase